MINVIAQFKTILATGISKIATSGVLDSNSSSDNDGATIPNGTYGVVIDERNSSREYAIITIDGYNFTFVKRGLSVIDGTTEKASNKFDHRKGAEIKIVSHPIIPLMVKSFNGLEPFGGVPLLPPERTLTEPRQVVDKEYADAIASAGIISMLVSEGEGLTVNINSGTYLLNGVVKNFSAVSGVAITDDATNYIQIKDGVLNIATDEFDNDIIPLAIVVAENGAITSITDKRSFYTGVDVKETGGLGRDSDGLFVKLATTPGLEIAEDVEYGLQVKRKVGGGLNLDGDGLSVAGSYSVEVGEELTRGDFVKIKKYVSNYKAAKIVGMKSEVTGSVSKAGDILKIKRLSSTKVIILTTTKLYAATFDGTTLSALTDITPTNGSTDFDILSSTKVVSVRGSVSGSYNYLFHGTIIEIGESVVIGGETTVTAASGSAAVVPGGVSVAAMSETSFVICAGNQTANYTHSCYAVAATVSGSSIVFGTPAGIGTSGYDNNRFDAFPARSCFKVDDSHFMYTYSYQSSGYTRGIVFAFGKLVGTTITHSSQNIDMSGGTDWPSYGFARSLGKIFLIAKNETVAKKGIGTISGDTVSFSLSSMSTGYTINELLSFEDSIYIRVGTTLYRLNITTSEINESVQEQLTVPNLTAILDDTALNSRFVSFSNDTAIKTRQFLLDVNEFIGIADKTYSTEENFPISFVYEKDNLVPGTLYYIGQDGQSLSYDASYRKIGRAITPTLILKE